ncbi:TPA: hypothetical protein O2I56_001363 [Staphylococcus aureus]|nr:hypothetical protein [Staphylococcus aureus]HDH6337297.1 hypothetical protein [Staphylococcus aureus LTCF-1-1]HDH6340106.1 hypothetical protein [Staphylococcus aureus LTCF-1-2]HCZ0453519.1 hypothetical protein [Staphylococcus aureus]HCZ0464031.1 hypothetical protein [Staphylococcus aureus]
MDLKKFEELYKDYSDDDVIEQFAIYKITDEKQVMEITDKKLTSEDKQVFQRIANLSYQFNVVKEMYDYYLYDFQVITDYIKDKSNLNNKFKSVDFVNLYFLHFLSTARAFYQYTENLFKSIGKKEFEEWKNNISNIYDNNFSYRLCYQMRNFTQHHGLAITNIKEKLNLNCNGEEINDYQLFIDPSILLNTNYKWNKTVKSDLEKHNGLIDFYQLITDYDECIKNMLLYSYIGLINKYRNELNQLMSKAMKIEGEMGIPFLRKAKKKEFREYYENIEFTELKGSKAIIDIFNMMCDLYTQLETSS